MDSLHRLLDRDLARAATRENVSKISPVLQEVIDEGLRAFERCLQSADEKDIHVGAVFSFLHLLEMLDGVDVCLRESAVIPAQVLLRSAFEAFLALHYLSEDDQDRRGAGYIVAEINARIRDLERWDPESPRGKQLRAEMGKDPSAADIPLPIVPDLEEELRGFRETLQEDHLREAAAEYERVRVASKKKYPPFHQLFGGPGDLEQLARATGWGAHYQMFYRAWSRTAHAADLRRQLTSSQDSPGVRVLRSPEEMLKTYQYAISLGLDGLQTLLKRYRPEELDGDVYGIWYRTRIRPVYRSLTLHGRNRPDTEADGTEQLGSPDV